MTLLSAADFPAVRAAIEAWVSTKELPDAVVALDTNQGIAEDWLLAAIAPTDLVALALNQTAETRARRAAILYLAAWLAPTLASLSAENVDGQLSYQRKAYDGTARRAALLPLADAQLSAALAALNQGQPDTTPAVRPNVFALGSSGRGRSPNWNRPRSINLVDVP